MPVHYGCAELHFQTISSPLATQIPQAAGAAYACKLEGAGRVVACFFGEGAASEGDMPSGLNIAATTEAPVLFICRNNGYAISTPAREQYRGDGIAARGIAYGMHTLRVDGGDVFAVLAAMRTARAIAVGGGAGAGGEAAAAAPPRMQPVLIEAMAYREAEEVRAWREAANPVRRLRRYMERAGWWDDAAEAALVARERSAVLAAMQAAERKPRPQLRQLVTDVYKDVPPHIEEQYVELQRHMAKYPAEYPQ